MMPVKYLITTLVCPDQHGRADEPRGGGGLRVGDVFSRVFKLPLAILFTSSYVEEHGTVRGDLTVSKQITMTSDTLGDKVLLVDDLVDSGGTLCNAAEALIKDGFEVMVYCSDDPIAAKQLEEIGCVAVMPLASLIGSGMGILNPWNLQIIIDQAKVPIVVDAGVGTASDAAIAMELGCHGVLMNTAIATAKNPVLMASAMKKAVEAGREAFLAGRMPKKPYAASPSSPTGGLIGKP